MGACHKRTKQGKMIKENTRKLGKYKRKSKISGRRSKRNSFKHNYLRRPTDTITNDPPPKITQNP